MFKSYVKSLETRIDSLEAFVCSLSYRMSELDKLPKEECPVCKEIKALEVSQVGLTFDPLKTTVVPWPVPPKDDRCHDPCCQGRGPKHD